MGGRADVDAAPAPGGTTWWSSGLAELTGRAEGPPLGPVPGLSTGLGAFARTIAERSAVLGRPFDPDPLEILAARARLGGLRRNGSVSCGGTARLLPAADGWVALNLARITDWELVPAWLGLTTVVADGDWERVGDAVVGRTGDELIGRAAGLGLPLARVGERRRPARVAPDPPDRPFGISVRRLTDGPPPTDAADLSVADLSALWAGPLVGAVLARVGANVTTVESTARPDGARRGSPAHYAALHAGRTRVRLDFGTPAGRRRLHDIVDRADVVITSARPRAISQLGLDPERSVRTGRTRVWVSITGYGTGPADADRVAFGDDAAAAGGLVVWDGEGPCFCADAVADPATGLAASAAVLSALSTGGGLLIDGSMADVAAGLVDTSVDGDAVPEGRP